MAITYGQFLTSRGFRAAGRSPLFDEPMTEEDYALWRAFDLRDVFVTIDGRNWFTVPKNLRRHPQEVVL